MELCRCKPYWSNHLKMLNNVKECSAHEIMDCAGQVEGKIFSQAI